MQLDSIRPVADKLERYFDWYMRVDPDVTPQALDVVARFSRLVFRQGGSASEARALLERSSAFCFGSAWEEMRAALLVLAEA